MDLVQFDDDTIAFASRPLRVEAATVSPITMTRNGRAIVLIAMAVLVPSLIQTALMLAFHGSSTTISGWINQYGLLVLLAEVAIGSVFLFLSL